MAKENTEIDRSQKKGEVPSYSAPLARLSTDLRLLRDLNVELQRSIVEMEQKRREEFFNNLASDKNAHKELVEFVNTLLQHFNEAEKLKKNLRFSGYMSNKAFDFLSEGTRALIWPKQYSSFVRDMSLVYLIAEFESCLEEIMRITFESRPEILIPSKKTVTIGELIMKEDGRAVKRQLIRKELSSISGQSVDDINVYVKKRFGIELSQFPDWRLLKERFYRRNIIVHNSGIVNDIYRIKTGYKGKDMKLQVTEKYLGKSIDMFESTCTKMAQLFCEKFG